MPSGILSSLMSSDSNPEAASLSMPLANLNFKAQQQYGFGPSGHRNIMSHTLSSFTPAACPNQTGRACSSEPINIVTNGVSQAWHPLYKTRLRGVLDPDAYYQGNPNGNYSYFYDCFCVSPSPATRFGRQCGCERNQAKETLNEMVSKKYSTDKNDVSINTGNNFKVGLDIEAFLTLSNRPNEFLKDVAEKVKVKLMSAGFNENFQEVAKAAGVDIANLL